MQPPPSSLAPVPTSHESKCPPISTISCGSSRPRNSPTTLCGAGCRPRSRFHREPDPNGDTAILETLKPVGVFGGDGRGGNLGEPGFAGGARVRRAQTRRPADRTSVATAPRLAAWDGPVER